VIIIQRRFGRPSPSTLKDRWLSISSAVYARAVSFGEDFVPWQFRLPEGMDDQPEELSGGHRHFPYARRVRLNWTKLRNGTSTFDKEDDQLWEVFCAECGDTDGPAGLQSESVQRLRGPYKGEHKARRVASHHFKET
jgi:hypothetical protein